MELFFCNQQSVQRMCAAAWTFVVTFGTIVPVQRLKPVLTVCIWQPAQRYWEDGPNQFVKKSFQLLAKLTNSNFTFPSVYRFNKQDVCYLGVGGCGHILSVSP